jgi:hypothetical protein
MIENKNQKFVHDEYGNVEMNGKKYRVKIQNMETGEIIFEPIEDETKFQKDFDEIVDKLSEQIDKKALMKDVLRLYPKKEISEIHDRIFKDFQPIRAKRGCYEIMVGRKSILIRQ